MHPHDRANVTGQIPPTRRHRQVFSRVQPVCVDHEISIVLVHARRLAPVS